MAAETHVGSVTRWIHQLENGQASEAQQQLWNRYFERLTKVARQRLPRSVSGIADEEDVALSVLNSFFANAGDGRYPELSDRTGLWPLLAKMAVCKTLKQRRDQHAQKRGGGMVRGASQIASNRTDGQAFSLDDFAGLEPNPESVAELRALTDHLMSKLETDTLRFVAQRKLEGYRNDEIATEMGVGLRTVERKLMRIRTHWSMHYPE